MTMMKKLRLHVEELKVESFPTAPTAEERGTVRGNAVTLDGGNCKDTDTLLPPSCPVACETYDDSVCGLTWHCVTDDC
jgi:hypothetical protein